MAHIPSSPAIAFLSHGAALIGASLSCVGCGGDPGSSDPELDLRASSLIRDDVRIPTTGTNAPTSDPQPIHVDETIDLHSLPGAPATLYLDFNGHQEGSTSTPPFDRDVDPVFFSAEEQAHIEFIWSYVAEAYAPFNIDVTTVDPDPDHAHPGDILRVVVSGESDFRGDGKGGFAEYDCYADDDELNIAYVFARRDTGQFIPLPALALAAAHEAGHAFGLRHFPDYIVSDSWRPIMADTLGLGRATWWSGVLLEIRGPNNQVIRFTQDDMAVIAGDDNGFGRRPDDHSNGTVGATPLRVTNGPLFGSGVIERSSDIDTFHFATGGGDVSLRLEIARSLGQWCEAVSQLTGECFTADPPGFGNLDAQLRLLASDGSTIAEDAPEDSQRAAITATLPAGTYSVQVKSREGYADVGQYSVAVSETRGPRVVRAEVAAAAPEQSLLAFTFDEAVHGSTFGVDDVRVGFAPGASVLSVEASGDGITQFVRIANSPTAARMNVTIGPEIADLFGNRLDQNQNGVGGEASDTYTFEVLSVAAPVLQP